MIAEDFGPVVHNGHVRVLATESIAWSTVEGACARTARVYTGPKDPRGHGQRSLQPAHRQPATGTIIGIAVNFLKQ